MAQTPLENMFEDDGNPRKKLDDSGEETYSERSITQAVYQNGIVAEFYIDPKSGKLASLFYEARHVHKVNEFRVAISSAGHLYLRTNLSAFIHDYEDKLKQEGLLGKLDNDEHDKEEIKLGDKPEDGILHRHTYIDNSIKTLEKIAVVVVSVGYKRAYQ